VKYLVGIRKKAGKKAELPGEEQLEASLRDQFTALQVYGSVEKGGLQTGQTPEFIR